MHPYREPVSEPRRDGAGVPPEEWAIAGLLTVLGGARVIIALARGEDFAVDVTLAALLGAIGLVLFAKLGVRALRG